MRIDSRWHKRYRQRKRKMFKTLKGSINKSYSGIRNLIGGGTPPSINELVSGTSDERYIEMNEPDAVLRDLDDLLRYQNVFKVDFGVSGQNSISKVLASLVLSVGENLARVMEKSLVLKKDKNSYLLFQSNLAEIRLIKAVWDDQEYLTVLSGRLQKRFEGHFIHVFSGGCIHESRIIKHANPLEPGFLSRDGFFIRNEPSLTENPRVQAFQYLSLGESLFVPKGVSSVLRHPNRDLGISTYILVVSSKAEVSKNLPTQNHYAELKEDEDSVLPLLDHRNEDRKAEAQEKPNDSGNLETYYLSRASLLVSDPEGPFCDRLVDAVRLCETIPWTAERLSWNHTKRIEHLIRVVVIVKFVELYENNPYSVELQLSLNWLLGEMTSKGIYKAVQGDGDSKPLLEAVYEFLEENDRRFVHFLCRKLSIRVLQYDDPSTLYVTTSVNDKAFLKFLRNVYVPSKAHHEFKSTSKSMRSKTQPSSLLLSSSDDGDRSSSGDEDTSLLGNTTPGKESLDAENKDIGTGPINAVWFLKESQLESKNWIPQADRYLETLGVIFFFFLSTLVSMAVIFGEVSIFFLILPEPHRGYITSTFVLLTALVTIYLVFTNRKSIRTLIRRVYRRFIDRNAYTHRQFLNEYSFPQEV